MAEISEEVLDDFDDQEEFVPPVGSVRLNHDGSVSSDGEEVEVSVLTVKYSEDLAYQLRFM